MIEVGDLAFFTDGSFCINEELPSIFQGKMLWELMQFTGLMCNGHEWYEGDILENDGDWYQVIWDKDGARWEALGIGSTGECLALSELLSQETFVQGNIYQHAHLLTK